tara:strand:+ start:27 stop:1586 length:1560 start_codon:yes stop_codon:yes gene_type:complete
MRFSDIKIVENMLGASPTPTSLPGYINQINQILSAPNPSLQLGKTGQYVFKAIPGQRVQNVTDVIDGEGPNHLGKNVEKIEVKTIYKGQLTGQAAAEKGKLDFNRGEITEGYHALAAFVRLQARPTRDITLEEVVNWIPKIKNGETFKLPVKDAENQEIADEFHVTISLKPGTWEAFQNPTEALKDAETLAIAKNVIEDANEETGRRADVYATNGRYDLVRVVGDGVSGETETKTDINFENETEKKYRGYSIKAGTTNQIHQVGGGGVVDGRGKKKATPEERFRILQDDLFGVHGLARLADLSKVKADYLKTARDESLQGRLAAQEVGYREAVDSINDKLSNDNEEKTFVKTLAKALKFFLARDDDSILLKQFSGKGTFILDPKRFDELHDKGLDLVAEYVEGMANPQITIKDKFSNKELITFRTYKASSGYMRNYIEKGELFKELTDTKKAKEGISTADRYIADLKNMYSNKKKLTPAQTRKVRSLVDRLTPGHLKTIADADIPFVSDAANQTLKSNN